MFFHWSNTVNWQIIVFMLFLCDPYIQSLCGKKWGREGEYLKPVHVLTLRKAWPQLAKQEQYNLQCVCANADRSKRSCTQQFIQINDLHQHFYEWGRNSCTAAYLTWNPTTHTLTFTQTIASCVTWGIGVTVSQMIRARCLTADTLRTILYCRGHVLHLLYWLTHGWVCTQWVVPPFQIFCFFFFFWVSFFVFSKLI